MTYPFMSLTQEIEKAELLAQGNFGPLSWENEQLAAWLRELKDWREGKMEKRLKSHDELISRREVLESLHALQKDFSKFNQLDDRDRQFLMGVECAAIRIAGLPYIYKKSSEKK